MIETYVGLFIAWAVGVSLGWVMKTDRYRRGYSNGYKRGLEHGGAAVRQIWNSPDRVHATVQVETKFEGY